jgi:hypothetical protein
MKDKKIKKYLDNKKNNLTFATPYGRQLRFEFERRKKY